MKKVFLFAACLFLFTGLMAQTTTARKAVAKPAVNGAQANQLTLDSAKSNVAAKAVTKPGVHGAQSNQLTLDSAKSGVAAKAVTKPGVRGEQANQLTVDSVKGGGGQVSRTISSDKQAKAVTDFIKQTPTVEVPPKKKPGSK
jgi:hypothetical protein